MKQLRVIILLGIFAGSLYVLYKGLSFVSFIYSPASNTSKSVLINIHSGMPFSEVVKQLKKHGVISDTQKFKVLAKIKGIESKIKAGELEFNTAWRPLKVIHTLVYGKEKLYKVTIPEGFNIYQIAKLLKQLSIADGDKFLNLVRNKEFLRELDFAYDSMEGYLFPSTYRVPKDISTKRLIVMLYKKFQQVFNELRDKYGQNKLLDDRSIVIMASIIEKETSKVEEMPKIASVFYNRLKLGMKLQSDPTVIYGMWDIYDGNIRRKDLRHYTPYNTYVVHGLPVAPIANPGKNALKAAFKPAKTEFLFFVSNNNGSHIFTKTYAEHKRKVYMYQIRHKK